jgi:uncharacterized protein YneF (UPF0154 family)
VEKNRLIILAGIGTLFTGLIAVLTYVSMKDHRAMLKDNTRLDNELKQLELEMKKAEIKKYRRS